MTDGKVAVREKATGQTYRVWSVDARELLRSGEYEPDDEAAVRVQAGKPIEPLRRPAPTDPQALKAAHAAEVAKLSARTASVAAPVAVSEPPAPFEDEPSAPAPRKRSRGKS